MAYQDSQVDAYLAYIEYPRTHHTHNRLALLTQLQARQIGTVPCESLSLHYSTTRRIPLDLEALFDKIVNRHHGGYCMEVNAFFGAVLRGLGFDVLTIGARVMINEVYNGWSHSANVVTIGASKYLVDVGFGSNSPMHPIPLLDCYVFQHLALSSSPSASSPARGKLEFRSIEAHTHPDQRLWVYSYQASHEEDWKVMYCFSELEFLPQDFEIINYMASTEPRSYFVNTVLAMRGILEIDRKTGDSVVVGVLTLHKNEIKRRVGNRLELLETLKTEEQRVDAIGRYFRIELTQEEREAIKGTPTELVEQV